MTDLIRAVFEEQADRAPDVAGLRAALAPGLRTPRRWAVPAVAAAVVAVVLGFAVWTRPEAVPPAGYAPPDAPDLTVAMEYRPTDLPHGFTERHRLIELADGHWSRTWLNGTGRITLGGRTVEPSATAHTDPATAPVEDPQGSPWITWRPRPDLELGVRVTDVPDALLVARAAAVSVVAAPGTGLTVPAQFGWLPDNLMRGTVQAGPGPLGSGQGPFSGETVYVTSTSVGTQDPGDHPITAEITRLSPTLHGERTEVTVRGLPGVLTPGVPQGARTLTARLADGRWLRIRGGTADTDLIRIADGMRIGPDRPWNWFGR
ncbi:hypothetical protein UO65_4585 [Actinokineospora spheciospongiae]|uniref:Uncharacterized protein n=1 Tax=Actinokineospora spheciospongiae TaxID=909613 RepID=W7IGZ1_9PSEU|nr:hypothetical protein [Actinokineospora spheciospongiae]EWC60145.1 hypothetical protein UO65_4585 [Actinokineospora spheciospongiae]